MGNNKFINELILIIISSILPLILKADSTEIDKYNIDKSIHISSSNFGNITEKGSDYNIETKDSITVIGNHNNFSVNNGASKDENDKDNAKELSSYYFNKILQIRYIDGMIAPNIQFKIGENIYCSDMNGNIQLTNEDRKVEYLKNLMITDNMRYIVSKDPNFIIINKLPNDISIIDPQNNNNIKSFEPQYIQIEYICDNQKVSSDIILNKLTSFEFYNNNRYYEQSKIELTNNLNIFKIDFDNNINGKLEIRPYINIMNNRIASSKPSIFYSIKRLFPLDLKKLFQHPNMENLLLISENYITYKPKLYIPLVTKIIEKTSLGEKHYIEVVFSLQGNNSFISVNISGIQFKFVKKYKFFYASSLFKDFFVEKIKNKQYELYNSISSDRFNIIRISSYIKENFLCFKISSEFNGESYPPKIYEFTINRDLLDHEVPLEIECGIDKSEKNGKVSIKHIDVY